MLRAMKNLVAPWFLALALIGSTGCPEKKPEDSISQGPAKAATSAAPATPPPQANPPANHGGW
jgi:hypothetical protein